MQAEQTLPLALNRESDEPLYAQLYKQLRELILTAALPPRRQLPPSRKLAREMGIGRITVVQAYEQLEAEGYVASRPGAGTFVAAAAGLAADEKPARYEPALSSWGERVLEAGVENQTPRPRLEIEFGFGRSFPHIFPYDIWRRLLARYLSTDDIMLSRYGSTAGFLPLREALAAYLARQRGVHCTPEQVVIVSGAQQALDILARLLLKQGDPVLVESPGYRDAFTLFSVHGAHLVPLRVDDKGFPVEHIPPGCQARLIFVTPSHQFPRGGTLPLDRRLALLHWAQEQDALIVEDDYDGELRYDGHPLAALQGLDSSGHVLYLGTFSKVLFPALRLGYVVLPEALIAPFVRAKGLVDRGAPTLTQAAVADFLTEGHFERHLRRLRQAYGERREALVTAIATYLPAGVQYAPDPAGLHVMLYLPAGTDEKAFVRAAAASGVGVYPGAPFHLEESPPPSILLGFSGLDADQIWQGVRPLGAILGQAPGS